MEIKGFSFRVLDFYPITDTASANPLITNGFSSSYEYLMNTELRRKKVIVCASDKLTKNMKLIT